jgi:hypothetical protein
MAERRKTMAGKRKQDEGDDDWGPPAKIKKENEPSTPASETTQGNQNIPPVRDDAPADDRKAADDSAEKTMTPPPPPPPPPAQQSGDAPKILTAPQPGREDLLDAIRRGKTLQKLDLDKIKAEKEAQQKAKSPEATGKPTSRSFADAMAERMQQLLEARGEKASLPGNPEVVVGDPDDW